MLKQIKTLGLVLVIGSMLVGCESTDLKDTQTKIYNTIKEVNDEATGESDGRDWLEDIEGGYEFTIDYPVLKCLELVDAGEITNIEAYFKGVLKYVDCEGLTDEEALNKMIDNYNAMRELHEILNKEETTEVKEDPKQEEKKEVVKEEPQEYCEWCEINTDHNSNDHIGQCYDCGEEMPAGKMTFNGRSFHCGCENDRISCGYCGTSVIRKNAYQGSYCNQQCYDGEMISNSDMFTKILCNGCGGYYEESDCLIYDCAYYCLDCYTEIMGPAQ